jgi:hypothetical protein
MAVVALGSCGSSAATPVDVSIPANLTNSTAWIEVGALRGLCPASTDYFGDGLPPDGLYARSAFAPASSATPSLGDVPKGVWGFAAVARAADCTILAAGCNNVDVSKESRIRVDLTPTTTPSGACSVGSVCQRGRCVPTTDVSSPAWGAGCSLELVGAGPLPNPLVPDGTLTSNPAMVATDGGFLLAYREFDRGQGVARLTLMAIDQGGGALAPIQETLGSRCPSAPESDAVAMAFGSSGGLVVVSRASCAGRNPGLNLFAVDGKGTVLKRGEQGFAQVRNLHLSNAHALAAVPSSADYLLAVVRDSRASLLRLRDVAPTADGAVDFGGEPPHTEAWITMTEQATTLMALGTAGTSPSPDGGAPDGGLADGGGGPSPTADAGPRPTLVRVQQVTQLGALPAPSTFTGSWASLAGQSTRAFVIANVASPGRPVTLSLFDLGQAMPKSSGYTPLGFGSVLYGDVAVRQDRLFVGTVQEGSITLAAYGRAATTPSLLREVALGRTPRIPASGLVRDGRLAIAASDTQVGVTWLTAEKLTKNDPVGGYAIFACRTP